MNWLAILELAATLLAQALKAFAEGHRKESPATVLFEPEHADTIRALARQCG